jgi:hypothetical protein
MPELSCTQYIRDMYLNVTVKLQPNHEASDLKQQILEQTICM